MKNESDVSVSKKLRFIKPIGWNDVFSLWRDAEANLPRWIEHYKTRGFGSWDKWRAHTLKDLSYENLAWKLFEVKNPIETVPHFFGGPFRAWIKKYYHGNHESSFAEIIKNQDLAQSQIVQEMFENFPLTTYLVGIQNKKRIVIIEGMHRCCALALANLKKKEIKTKVFLSLAQSTEDLSEMGQVDSPT